jgi:threonyl-tRNA synthetase
MPIKEKNQVENELADLRFRIRHSAAHIMAEAVLKLFPEAQFAVGPPIENGFYYDFHIQRPFAPEDLEQIEAAMRESIAAGAAFEQSELSLEEAKTHFAGQPFKLEIIDAIPDGEAVTTYTHRGFVDLCRGPHVAKTSDVAAFKLMNVAGAYWRGDEHNEMLQRTTVRRGSLPKRWNSISIVSRKLGVATIGSSGKTSACSSLTLLHQPALFSFRTGLR